MAIFSPNSDPMGRTVSASDSSVTSSSSAFVRMDSRTYGGDFPWTGARYKLKTAKNTFLGLMNGFAKKLFVLDELVLAGDGNFRRPSDGTLLFPVAGVDLKWRWNEDEQRIIIDFWDDKGHLLAWRWDELTARGDITAVPDWTGVGHVGRFKFQFELLSSPAEPKSGGYLSAASSDSTTAPGDESPRKRALQSQAALLAELEPITKSGESFEWWRQQMDEARSKKGEGMGSVFRITPLEATLGTGNFGQVWLAQNRTTKDRFAVKNMKVKRTTGTLQAIAQNEFLMAEKIHLCPHPYIVTLHSVESFTFGKDGLYMLVMEYCPGGDLQTALEECIGIDGTYTLAEEAYRWIGQIFLAVEHIHTKLELLIRDLKPGNVVLSSTRRAKLTDFGYGRLLAESPGGAWTFNAPPSTPGYAAPELLSMEPYSYGADIYSLGALMWVVLSGGDKSKDVPVPPTAGRGSDYGSYQDDWQLLQDALENQTRGRTALEEDALDIILDMTQREQETRPCLEGVRESKFIVEKCLPEVERAVSFQQQLMNGSF